MRRSLAARLPLWIAAGAVGAPSALAQGAPGGAAVSATVDSTAPGATREPPSAAVTGFENGLRLGYSIAAGDSASGRPLADQVASRIPVWADIGYRLDRTFYFAIFGQIGLDGAGDACEAASPNQSASCTVEDWRLGLEMLVHVLDADAPDLWVGLGLAWEQMNQTIRYIAPIDPALGFGDEATVTEERVDQGPLLELQAGLDLPVEGKLRAGPFATYAVGTYVDRSFSCIAATDCPTAADEDAALHHFFTLGARATFGP